MNSYSYQKLRGAQHCVLFSMRSVVLLLLLPFLSQGQIVFNGKVVEKYTGQPIPYATIGLVKQNTGTNANEQGEFTISCHQPAIDTLIISCVGYMSIRLPVKDLTSKPVPSLSVNIRPMRAVVIKNQWMYDEVGKFRGYPAHCFTTNGYQSQIARKLTVPFTNSCLQTLHIQTSEQRGRSMVRIRVYDFDSVTKGPAEELTDTLIQVSLKPGITSIDMLAYQICLPQKDFFLAVEWLLIPFNEHRFSAKFEGKMKEFLNFKPCICFTKDKPSGPLETWGLAYSDKWYPLFRQESIAISATIRY